MEAKVILEKVVEKQNLTYDEAYFMLDNIMKGTLDPALVSAYLVALRMKGETVEEITASAKAMRDNGTHLENGQDAMEIVGTGGDKAFTFNISSVSSFVIAANGIKVCKHGNRSVSSKSGAADLYEALGVNISTDKGQAEKILSDDGIIFLFAQKYHTSMKNVGPIRKSLGIRTIFNILGPLTNPALAENMLIGVYDEKLVRPIAEVLDGLGAKNALVVHGMDGLDEVTLVDRTKVCELRNHTFKEYYFDPKDYGFRYCSKEDLVGGDPQINKQIALDILTGKERGPKRDVVIINAALAIYAFAKDITIEQAIRAAENAIDMGSALAKMESYVKDSNK